MLEFRNVDKYFNRSTQSEIQALSSINLEVAEGEFVVLIGSNGSGKSTLLNVIAGNLIPDSGKIFVGGNDITTMPEHKRSKWISRVFQNPLAGSASELSVVENFRLFSLRTRIKSLTTGINESFRKTVADQLSTLGLGIENKLDQPIGTLSGGQRQAITLLMAVMDDTRLLLMDEPASALDPVKATLVMKLANTLSKKHHLTTILVTHNLRDAIAYGDRIILMSQGKIVKDVRGDEKKTLTAEEVFRWF